MLRLPIVYYLPMENYEAFDLPQFMLSHFGRVDFGGNLFAQWPVGIRFDIGITQVSRAESLYNFMFAKSSECILVSQDWITDDALHESLTPLFRTPGIFQSEPCKFKSINVSPFDETKYRLTWTRLHTRALNILLMFQGIANREREGTPQISSRVYIIEPSAKIIMHMYDDRGLDIIATELETLRPLFLSFGEWILEYERHRVEFRFKTKPAVLPA